MQVFWARLASFGHLGLISDPLIDSKLHNETHDPKGQENKIYTIVKGRETFYRHTQSQSPAVVMSNMFFKRLSFGSKFAFVWKKHISCDKVLCMDTCSRSSAFCCQKLTHAISFIMFNLDRPQSLKQFFINVSYHILVASLTLMGLFKTKPSELDWLQVYDMSH